MTTLEVSTRRRCEMIDVTDRIARAVREAGVRRGAVVVYVPHTTAGVTINENADPDVQHDMLLTLEELIPRLRPGYRHAEGNSDSHVKTSLFGPGLTLIVHDGRIVLGTWQGIFLAEWDGPRTRQVVARLTP